MKDVTKRYVNMIESFECDFALLNIKPNEEGKEKIRVDFPNLILLLYIFLLLLPSFFLHNFYFFMS